MNTIYAEYNMYHQTMPPTEYDTIPGKPSEWINSLKMELQFQVSLPEQVHLERKKYFHYKHPAK